MKKILVLIVMTVVIIALSGCTGKSPEKVTPTPGTTEETPITPISPTETIPTETTSVGTKGITFDSIDKGSQISASLEKPAIFIAGNMAEAEKFTKWDSTLADKIKNVDFNNKLVIAVFWGVKTTSGYEITVKDISQIGEKIKITVATSGPIEAASGIITYPYHIVAIDKGIKMTSGTVWEVSTEDGTQLVQTTYP